METGDRENEGALAHLLQWSGRGGGGDGVGQVGKDLTENQLGKVAGDTFFIEPPLLERALMEGAAVAPRRQEGIPRENESEDLQPVQACLLGERKKAPS
jgi:hypothetical protein